jgi:hypothetical protein
VISDLLLLLVGLLPFAVVGFFLVRAARRTTRHQLLKTVLFFAILGALFLLVKLMVDRWGHLFPS